MSRKNLFLVNVQFLLIYLKEKYDFVFIILCLYCLVDFIETLKCVGVAVSYFSTFLNSFKHHKFYYLISLFPQ